jgi:hypothetical protein
MQQHVADQRQQLPPSPPPLPQLQEQQQQQQQQQLLTAPPLALQQPAPGRQQQDCSSTGNGQLPTQHDSVQHHQQAAGGVQLNSTSTSGSLARLSKGQLAAYSTAALLAATAPT